MRPFIGGPSRFSKEICLEKMAIAKRIRCFLQDHRGRKSPEQPQ
jgi:hypothetical protein